MSPRSGAWGEGHRQSLIDLVRPLVLIERATQQQQKKKEKSGALPQILASAAYGNNSEE